MSDTSPSAVPAETVSDPKPTISADKPTPERSAIGLRFTGAAVLVIAVLGIAAYLALLPPPLPNMAAPTPGDPELAARLSRIEGQLAQRRETPAVVAPAPDNTALIQRLAALEQAAGQSQAVTAGVEAMRRELAVAEEKRTADIAALAAQLSATETPQDKALELRLRAIEERVLSLTATTERVRDDLAAAVKSLADRAQADAGAAARLSAAESRLALTQAALRLRGALSGSAPFAPDLAVARAAAANNPALLQILAPLEAQAAKGLPTIETLRASFPQIAGAALGASVAPAESGWAGGILRRLGSAVSIRPVGEVAGSGTDAVIARTEARLASGDLEGAVAALAGLQDQAAIAAVAPWLERARARLAGEAALRAMLSDPASSSSPRP